MLPVRVRQRQRLGRVSTRHPRGARASPFPHCPGQVHVQLRAGCHDSRRREGKDGSRDKVEANLGIGVVGREALPDRSSTGGSDLETQDSQREGEGSGFEQDSLLPTPQCGSRDTDVLLVPVLLLVEGHVTTPPQHPSQLNVLWAHLDLSQ